ncbi:MAG: hypothetical protein GXP32_08150 [Kiritimatiellaeota bacterium]|nr:hypothetical protein [Kiritimatiellota bacterium]
MMKTNCPHCNGVSEYASIPENGMVECPVCSNLFVPKQGEPAPLPCPDCGNPVEPGARICVSCGYNFDTGKKVEKHIPVYGENFSRPRKVLCWVADMVPGLFRPGTLVLFILSVIISLMIFYLGLFVIGMGAMLSGIMIASFSLVVYAHGVGWLMTGEIQMLRGAMVELTGGRWTMFLFLVFAPVSTGLFLVIWVFSTFGKG